MSASSPAVPVAAPRSTGYRWKICALLFFATFISYIDRGVIGYLEKYLEGVIGWNSIQYSYMTASFQTAYAIGLFCAGWLTDRMGTRRGFAIAIVLWSCAAMLPGAAFSALTFGIAMFFLGLGESANFPACIKTVAEWFPRKQRALATAIFNSGSSVGNIVVPLIVPFLTYRLGWRGAFVGTGALGFVWLAFWLRMYAKPRGASQCLLSGAGLHPKRAGRALGASAVLAHPALQGDVGLFDRKISDRCDLVVLSVLAAALFAGRFSPQPETEPDSGDGGLRHLLHRRHCRRLVAVDHAA